ncbi:hypothetical protein A1O7_09155 [Cladophialophora yegresii CBS 114405]|uniref:RED-like N-terminal domain-containing protein n=1 Tax=Cladophialophora yegresii CBS 114405 TaxID=1182544 RepID=W9W5I0_9EURO|nr:uncharacterized protein A1O7_09155 [Cladophialophora yegresii CBS 114405]EXJ53819.1 hypothetical protein A1O7_09155 [Cladophialophora yegresii CBS 114405]
MDNSQFRNLLQSNQNAGAQGAAASPPGFKKPALGSRSRASIPMTPRSTAGYNASKMFAQQVTDYRKEHVGQPPTKKLKSSAPKGTKLGSGYEDRTLARREGADDAETTDDKQKRLKALEEMYKLQQIDEATLENLKSEIGIGGDLNSTHLVKGLDWKLLERVRRGDDLNSPPQPEKNKEKAKVDLDEELDHMLEKEVQAVDRNLGKQQDDAGMEVDQPTTRDEILRRLKESRAQKQQGAPPEPALGDRFKKVASDNPNKRKFTEVVNGRRREVLLITNKDGTTKRKTRWIDMGDTPDSAEKQPLGMEVPAEFVARQQALTTRDEAEDEDDDIFQGVSDYNPLAGIDSDSEDEDHDKSEPAARKEKDPSSSTSKPRNYFATSNQDEEAEDRTNPILKDPTLLSALKRAAGLQRHDDSASNQALDSDPTRAAKQQQLLERLKEQNRADAADLDLGFGESRFGDDEDEDGPAWEDGEGSSKKSGRKRGPKKRKGDKDNVNDVMAAMQGHDRKS